MSFSLFNSFDGVTYSVTDGKLVTLNVANGSQIVIRQTDPITPPITGEAPTCIPSGTIINSIIGVSQVEDFGDPTKLNLLSILTVVVLQNQAGTFHGGVTMVGNGKVQRFGMTLIVHPDDAAASVGPVVADLPEDLHDVQVDLLLRTVTSNLLPLTDGFKVGDTVKFAVIPRRATTGFITAIDKITLAIRPAGKFQGDPLEFEVDNTPTVIGTGDGRYYLATAALTSPALAQWFSDANALAEGGDNSQDPNKLLVSAEIRFEESAVVTTSDIFQFTLFQSIVAPNP